MMVRNSRPSARTLGLPLPLVIAIISLARGSSASICNTTVSYNGIMRSYANCSDLVQDGASLAWSHSALNSTIDIAFSALSETYGGWVGWGINENCSKMEQASTLIGYRAVNGSTLLPYKLTRDLSIEVNSFDDPQPPPLTCGAIDLEILDKAVEIVDYEVKIFATVKLEPGQMKLNQIWNRGLYVEDFIPSAPCDVNRKGLGTLDLNTGMMTNLGRKMRCPIPNLHLKNRHAVINGVAWGILYPVSIFVGYISLCSNKLFHCLYVPSQFLAFSVGVAGFYTGAILHDLEGATDQRYHRDLGITIVSLATVQVTLTVIRIALSIHARRRNDNEDKDTRMLFMVLSAIIGYANNIVVVINIYEGIGILQPSKGWKTGWTVIAIFSFMFINFA